MPVARPVLLFATLALGALTFGTLALPGGAQAQTTAKQCADRWNDMKAKDQTGDLTYRQFSQSCMAGTGATPTTSAEKPKTTTPTPAAAKPTAAQALPPGSIKQCADRWNAMKAKDQTGNLTYREFSQSCLAGAVAGKPAEKPAAAETTEAKPKTSVPSIGTKPKATTAAAAREEEDETDKAALTRCNAEWKQEKERRNLSGAKAWHVFMARCL